MLEEAERDDLADVAALEEAKRHAEQLSQASERVYQQIETLRTKVRRSFGRV